MNCECNNKSNRVKPGIKHVYGNVLRMAIPLTLRTLVKDGDEMVVTDTDFIPSSDHPVRVVFSRGKTNYPIIATMDGNVAIVEDKGKIPVGTYDISVECYDDLGNPYRFKQNAVLYVADTTAEAGIDEEIEYEAQTWYLNAAVFLATTQIGEIGDAIDAKLDDVFGNVAYDANAKEIRFYNKDNSRVLATIDSRPFIADGTVADVYIDVGRQVLVVVLNEDAGGTRFSVPLYLVFAEYYKKDEVDNLVSRTVEGMRFDFSQKLPLVVPVTKNGSSYSSPVDFGAIDNAIREDGRLVVACVNKDIFYQLLVADRAEIAFSRVVALDGYQELLIVDTHNVWSMEDVDLGTGGGGGGYEPPAGGIPKSDLAQSVQDTLDDVVNKVDKETGKSLMTDAERTKLQGIAAGAEVNVQPNWTQTNTSADDYIKNKPTIPDTSTLATKTELNAKQDKINDLATIRSGAAKGATSVQTISVNGASLSPTDGNISISAVTGLQFDGSSHVGVVQLPEYVKTSDYNTKIDDIYQSIPSGLADLADDTTHRVVTDTEKNTWNGKQDVISDLATIRSGAQAGATAIQQADLAAVATSGSYNDLADKPVIPTAITVDSTITQNGTNPVQGGAIYNALDGKAGKTVIGVLSGIYDSNGNLTGYTCNKTIEELWSAFVAGCNVMLLNDEYTDILQLRYYEGDFSEPQGALYFRSFPTHNGDIQSALYDVDGEIYVTNQNLTKRCVPNIRKVNNKALSSDITLTASDVGAVPTTRTVNGKALSSNITLSASDVGALPSNTHIPADQVQSNWNETNTSSKAYIQNKPTFKTINGESIVGTGDIEAGSGNVVTPIVNVASTGNVTQELQAGAFYKFGTVDSLTITLAAGNTPLDGTTPLLVYGGKFTISASSNASSLLALPASVTISPRSDSVAVGKTYEFNIADNGAIILEM